MLRLDLLAECEASGEWPGRYPEAVILDAPGWYFPDAPDLDLSSLEMDDE